MRVLFDTNVIVDVLQRREPWYQDGRILFLAAANRRITGCLTAKEVTDLHFFSRKQFRGEENADSKARAVIAKLLGLFEVIDTTAGDCREAIAIPNGDYEDAVMIAAAAREGVDCIVTRNPDHFKPSSVPVLSPAALVRALMDDDKSEDE